MGLFNRKSQLQRLLETVSDSLEAVPSAIDKLPDSGSGKTLKRGLIAAGALAGLTAGSAAVSSRRRQKGETRDRS